MKKISLVVLLLVLGFAFSYGQEKRADYYENGKKKWEGHILDGKKMGEWVFYWDNGKVQREGIYRDGKPYEEWKEYWRNGELKSVGKYIVHNGKPVKHGPWVYYHKNGSEQSTGTFQAGRPIGMWYEYNTLGIEINKKQH